MVKKLLVVVTASLLMAGFLSPSFGAEEDDAPKYKIKDVMKKAMKGPLLKKVASGDASEDETKELYDMLVALSKNEVPKGEADSWKKLTGNLVKAGKAAVEGEAEAGDMLKKAANCKACHTNHKP